MNKTVIFLNRNNFCNVEIAHCRLHFCFHNSRRSKNAPESYLESFFEWHKQKDKLQKLMTAVTDYFFATNIRFTDEALQNLLLHMMILVERIELGHTLEQFELTRLGRSAFFLHRRQFSRRYLVSRRALNHRTQ